MEGNLEVFVTSVAMIVLPFVACGAIWLVGRVLVGTRGGGGTDRIVPPSTTRDSRVIPGTRYEEAD